MRPLNIIKTRNLRKIVVVTSLITVLSLSYDVLPTRAGDLLSIKDFCVCRMYTPGHGTNTGKIFLSFEYPHWLPEDALYIGVAGPEGFGLEFNQSPFDFNNWNGSISTNISPGWPPNIHYMAFTNQPMHNGYYVVFIIDREYNIIIGSAFFMDASNTFIPLVDTIDDTAFTPFDGQTEVSLNPTLAWDILEEADYFYCLRVRDGFDVVFMDKIFDNRTGLNKSSCTLPDGLLKPGTTYNWNVEICDSDIVSQINNVAWLPSSSFTTVTAP